MWIKLKPDDLGPYLYGPQRRFLENAPDEEYGGAFLEVLIKDLVAWVRAEIRSGKQTLSVRKETIPASLRGPVCWLLVETLQARFPPLHLTPDQKTHIRAARELIARLGNGTFRIEEPNDPQEADDPNEERPHGFSFLRWRIRDATGKRLRGL